MKRYTDKQRLDWLKKTKSSIVGPLFLSTKSRWHVIPGPMANERNDIREAIDAAMIAHKPRRSVL